MSQKSCILITGVAGFIGSNLLATLLNAGRRVVGIDNLSNGILRNIERYRDHPGFAFVPDDVTLPSTFDKLESSVDTIVHLAAYKIPRYGNSLDTLRINLRGTENVLEFARRRNSRVLFASTSDVYGKNPSIPFSEKHDLVIGESGIARWAYAASKIYDEHLCFSYAEKYDLPITIVRYFGGYGPHQHTSWWGGPQSVFIDAILKGKPVQIHGDGLQTRTFTYVDDLVRGTLLAMERKEAVGEIFNIGDTREISILQLAEIIWESMGSSGPCPLEFIPYKSFAGGKYEDVRRRVPDISKARNLLGFNPEIKLEEGLRRTIGWQKERWEEEQSGNMARNS